MNSNQFTEPRHFTFFTLLISLAAVLPAGAQSVTIQSQPVRVTVADSVTTNYLILGVATNSPVRLTNFVNLSNVTAVVDWSISGLPAGVGYTVFNYDQTAHDNTNNYGLNLVLNTTNVAQGEHIINLNATGGAENHFLLTLQSGRMWNGTTNVSTAWSSSSSWVGGIPPGASDDVLFAQLGAQPNTNSFFTNSIVSANTEIASLRFSQTTDNARYHTIQIDPGVTLRISGTKGLRILRDSTGLGSQMDVNFTGQEGRLVVSNKNANVADLVDNQNRNRFDMSTLGTFEADVNRVGFGDYALFPNYTNLAANGFVNAGTFPLPQRFISTVYLARTNVIKVGYVDLYNYTNGTDRNYAFSWNRNERQGSTATSGTSPGLYLGYSNLFLADSVEIGGFGATAALLGGVNAGMSFNTALVRTTNIVEGVSTNFTTNTSFYAYFRNTNGTGRVSVFAIADSGGTGTNYSGGNVKVWANFANVVGGTVNALVDKLYIARDKTNGTSYNTQGGLNIGQGLFDVNTAILGYQQYAGQTNVAYAQGNLTVTNTAVFKANESIELGYTTENINNAVAEPFNNRGVINIGPGGTVMANTILVGGVTKASGGNAINMNNGASLVVTNKIAGPDRMLSTLGLSGASTLTLHLNGTNTGYYVYATNLNVANGCTLNIASAVNLPIPPTGTNVPIFSFVFGGGNNFGVTMPSPMRGTVLGDVLNIITNQPKNLIWRGPGSTWNTDPANKIWLDTTTSLLTNYVNGDAVTFDDLASAPDTITLSGTLIPDSITVSNGTGNPTFIFSGSGTMPGGSLVKNGSGTVEIDANTTIPVQINQGAFTGTSAGSVGSVVVASGASMDFSGTVSPSGVTCAGTASLRGTVSGGLLVQGAGIVTNYGTLNGPFDTRDAALLVNASSGSLNIGASGSASGTVVSNATFINSGNIGAALVASTMSVNGVFKDMGLGTIYVSTLSINGSSLSNNAGAGTFIPGGDSIGTTTIKSPGVGGGNFPGRVVFLTGSTNVFKVNVDGPTNYTILRAAWTDFGPSVGAPSFNGGFVLVTNVGSSPLAAGQSFQMFKYEDDSLPIIQFGSTNSYPVMSPTNPAAGSGWDLSHLKPGGIVAIKSVPTTPTNITFLAFLSSRTNNAGVTNITVVTDMQWPSNYIAWSDAGWHLEEQNGNRTNGLRTDPTNWTPILETYFTNRVIFTNNVTSNSVSFWRMVYP